MPGHPSGRRGRGRRRKRIGEEASRRIDEFTPGSKNATPHAKSFSQRASYQKTPPGHNHDVDSGENHGSPIPITDSQCQEGLQQRQRDTGQIH